MASGLDTKSSGDLKKLHLKMIGMFIVILIVFELIIGLFFVNLVTQQIEQVRTNEFKQALNRFIQQSKATHESKLTGYAWWDEMAIAVDKNDVGYIKTSFIDDASLAGEYDIVELVRGDLSHLWSLIDKVDETVFYNSNPNTPEMEMKRAFLQYTNEAYDKTIAKFKDIPKREDWPSLIKPLAWHYIATYKGKVRLLTVSPLCDNHGHPYAKGFMVLGTNMQRIIGNAENIIPIKITMTKSDEKSLDSEAITVPGYNSSESLNLYLEPKVSIRSIANIALYLFIAFQVVLSVIIFALITPAFTRKYTKELQHTIVQRTEELRKTYASLQQAQGTLDALGGLLPMCSKCRKIRNEDGRWEQVDTYIHKHSDAKISHGVCPECAEELYGVKPKG